MPHVYVRNRLAAAAGWALESLVRRNNPHYELAPQYMAQSRAWCPASSSNAAIEHPEVKGLWLLQQAVDPAGVEAVRDLISAVTLPPRDLGVHAEADKAEREAALLLEQAAKLSAGTEHAIEASEQASVAIARREALRAAAAKLPPPPPPLRSNLAWEWYQFEPGRLMAAMLAHPAAGGATFACQQQHLEGFEVFGKAPVADWLSLERLASAAAPPEVAGGAARLIQLQRLLPTLLPCVATLDQPRCIFHQLQLLERGACIAAHVDAPTPPADVVATLSLGSGSVRVGGAHLSLRAGDVYAIAGAARWDVSHEVHASWTDRLSVTLRFASLGSLHG